MGCWCESGVARLLHDELQPNLTIGTLDSASFNEAYACSGAHSHENGETPKMVVYNTA